MGEQPGSILRDLLRQLAEADAEQVVQEAREGARTRAKAILEDALVDELLAAAAARDRREDPAPSPAAVGATPSPNPPAAQDRPPTGDAWWAYCVVSADDAGAASGIDGIEPGTRVEAVAEGDLAALVSPVPLAEYGDERLREHLEDIEWLEKTARGHEGVLEHVLNRAAIVPLRLCTLYRDREGIRRMLQQHAEALSGSLATVEGSTEWGVKVFLDQERAGAGPPSPEETQPSASGAGYLAKRQRERQATRQRDEMCEECVEEVHGMMAAIARDARLNPVQRPEAHGRRAEMLLNGAYLVGQDQVGEFSRGISLLQSRWSPRGFAVELTGPWPPYNFVAESAGMIS
jgi:hypothetical protein